MCTAPPCRPLPPASGSERSCDVTGEQRVPHPKKLDSETTAFLAEEWPACHHYTNTFASWKESIITGCYRLSNASLINASARHECEHENHKLQHKGTAGKRQCGTNRGEGTQVRLTVVMSEGEIQDSCDMFAGVVALTVQG